MDFIRRWRWIVAIAVLLLAGLAFAFWPRATQVDTATVTRGPMSVGITDDGVTRTEDYFVVSAPVTGYLDRIELEAGDLVQGGALVAVMHGRPSTPLDPRSAQELRASLASAQAASSGASASLDQSRRDLARAETLAERGFVSVAQLEAIRTRVRTGEAAMAQARAEIVRIRGVMAETSGRVGGNTVPVRSPEAGSVLAVINESAGVIAEGTPLVTIGDPERIEVVVDLLSRQAVRVTPGDRVEITQWGGEEPLIGVVDRIEPFGRLKVSALGIEEQRVNVIIRFVEQSRPAAARLGHGYQVDATIVLWRSGNALRLPIGALFRGPAGDWMVFVATNGRARQRAVELGRINDEYAEVRSGLAEGDMVVVNPGNTLQDGDRVAARDR
ncbi:MAG: efflux RND transporter periplasmic adaptor subunit [Pseudomonadota bacterium]